MCRERSPGSRQKPSLTRREIHIAGDRRQRDLVTVAKDDEFLKFARLTMQPIQPPDHHPVADADVDVLHDRHVVQDRLG